MRLCADAARYSSMGCKPFFFSTEAFVGGKNAISLLSFGDSLA